jgi:hypothetical protein
MASLTLDRADAAKPVPIVAVFPREHHVLELEKRTPLAFPIALKDGRIIATVGDAADYMSTLNLDQRERAHWKTAIMMFNNAMREARYLKIATMNLQSALVYDRLVEDAGP